MTEGDLIAHYAEVRARLLGAPSRKVQPAPSPDPDPVDLSPKIRTDPIHPMEIVRRVARWYGVTVADIQGPSRCRPEIRARHCAAYWLDRRRHLSLKQIAHFIGRSDHTTVLNAIKRHKISKERRRAAAP